MSLRYDTRRIHGGLSARAEPNIVRCIFCDITLVVFFPVRLIKQIAENRNVIPLLAVAQKFAYGKTEKLSP